MGIKLIFGLSKVIKLGFNLSNGIKLILPSNPSSSPFITCKQKSSGPILLCHVYPLYMIIVKSTNIAKSLFHLVTGYTSEDLEQTCQKKK